MAAERFDARDPAPPSTTNAPAILPGDRLRTLLAYALEYGRCPACGERSIVSIDRSTGNPLLICRSRLCGFHTIRVTLQRLRDELGGAAVEPPSGKILPYEVDLHLLLTEVVRHELCPYCGGRGALLRRVGVGEVAWDCVMCGKAVGPAAFELWRYLQSRAERGIAGTRRES